MPHVFVFIGNSTFKLPFVGLQRSWALVTKGGVGGVIGGILGIIPYAAGFAWIVYGFVSLYQQGVVPPLDDAGLGKAGGAAGCLSWLLVAVIGVGVEYIGYGVQSIFRGKVEIAEMEWG
jgi:hypothetical protein